MRSIAVFGAVLMTAAVAHAQDRAKPRGGEERERPPERVQPAPPPAAPAPPPQASAPPPRQERSEAEERHARPRQEQGDRPAPEAGRSEPQVRRPRPEPPRQEYGPRGGDGLTDAERRHPRPDPNRRWNERRYGWRDYPDYPWWYGRNEWYFFPYDYGFGWYDQDRYLDGDLVRPHRRYWSDDGVSFYWPFDGPPRLGCHWYWVPTERFTDRYGPFRNRRYRYAYWRLVYLCVDGRPYPW